jgi:hypothetical protein
MTYNPKPPDSTPLSRRVGPWAKDNIKQQAQGPSVIPTALDRDEGISVKPGEEIIHITTPMHAPSNPIPPSPQNCFSFTDLQRGYTSPGKELVRHRSKSLSVTPLTRAISRQPQEAQKSLSNLDPPADPLDDGIPAITRQLIKDLEERISVWSLHEQHPRNGKLIDWGADDHSLVRHQDGDHAAALVKRSDKGSKPRAGELREILLDVLQKPEVKGQTDVLNPDEPHDTAGELREAQDKQLDQHKCEVCRKTLPRACELRYVSS